MTYIEILIDTSGSMGAMQGTEHENKYLLPDGTTRMVFIKKMLREQLLPTIDYADKIVCFLFSFLLLANTNNKYFAEKKLVDKGYSKGALICGSLILAGAMGNLIDSIFLRNDIY